MASVIDDPGGYRRIQFTGSSGPRKTIHLGKMDRKSDESVCVHVERLVGAQRAGEMSPTDTRRWLARLDDVMHAKLAAVGLVPGRQATELEAWMTKYLAEQASKLKPESLRKLRQTATKLVTFLGQAKSLRKITPMDASEWRASMAAGLSEATLKIHAGNAKTIFAEAVRRGLIESNPFLHLASGPTACQNTRYVTPSDTAKIVDACGNHQFKLIFGLARYAGLRTPSESFGLTWGDVDWLACKLRVRSKKTERYAGHEQRIVPIVPELLAILQAAYDAAPEGSERIIDRKWTGFVPEHLQKIILAAGVEPWEDLFQTLRRSCEIEWAQRFPQYAVSKWIGHSITISGKHYANAIPEELYERVTRAAQNAAQQLAESAGKLGKVSAESVGGVSPNTAKTLGIPLVSASCQMGDEGFEPPTSAV